MASGRSWERPSWQRYFGMTPKQIEGLRGAARLALADGPLTREELVGAIVAQRGFRHVGEALRSGWGTLLKPLAWQGDLCHGPSQGTRVTFMLPEAASSRWSGVPDPEEAAPIAIRAYLGAYGPATMDAFGNWLAGGYFGKRQLRAWFGELEPQLAEVDVDGERAFVLAEDLDELAATPPTDRRATASGLRPVRARAGDRRRPRRACRPQSGGQQAERVDLAGRGRRRRRRRHVGAGRRPGADLVVRRGGEAAAERRSARKWRGSPPFSTASSRLRWLLAKAERLRNNPPPSERLIYSWTGRGSRSTIASGRSTSPTR